MMTKHDKSKEENCKTRADSFSGYRKQLPGITEKIIADCKSESTYTHIDFDPIPSIGSVVEIINRFKGILFPGYFTNGRLDPANLNYSIGQDVSELFDILSGQIANSIRHDCMRNNRECTDCETLGKKIALDLLEAIPGLRKRLATDVSAAYNGDPAAQSPDEVIFSYPGIFAIMVYRVAHVLFEHGVPLLPRVMTEYAHSKTGIDIHPGAKIEDSFGIDHGTGIVIGETTVIGKNVSNYQGVTLGAHSLSKQNEQEFKDKKRHPTIEDDVIIYSGTTILGGDTVIGARSIIGGNVWITESVPPDTKVILEAPKLVFK